MSARPTEPRAAVMKSKSKPGQDDLTLRPMLPTDRAGVWRVLEPAIRAGETYALPQEMSRAEALRYWTTGVRDVFVAEKPGRIEGTGAHSD